MSHNSNEKVYIIIINIKIDMPEDVPLFAVVFFILFIVGGIIGGLSLPDFDGRFFVSGLIFAAFGTGAGNLIFKR